MDSNAISHDRSGARRVLSWSTAVFALAVLAIYLSRPLYDPDFYWHLKTGQWIWENRSLPHTDLFGIPPLPPPSPRTEFIFTSYWLLQLVLYAFYSLSGMSGIIVFRWIIAVISLLVFARWANIRDSNVTAVIATGTILLLEFYFIERPQFISFVFFGIQLVILARFFDQGEAKTTWKTLVPLSLLMVVWANMHGGFLIGQAILVYVVIAEGIKKFHPSLSPLPTAVYRTLCIAAMTALVASFLNPNAINLIKYLPLIFDSNYYVNANNIEEMSLLEYFNENPDFTIILYIAAVALTFIALLASKQRKNITWVGILTGTAFMGCQHMRLMPFFLVAATLFASRYMEIHGKAMKARLMLVSMLAVSSMYCVRDEFPRLFEAAKSGWVPTNHFPVKAADYVVNNNIPGNIYTTMVWGGYMIWRMGPENKIFYDGRTLSVQRAWEYDNSRKVGFNQNSYWQGLFRTYDVKVVVLPVYEDDGSPNLLAQSIYADKDWAMVFADERDVVFIRTGSQPISKRS